MSKSERMVQMLDLICEQPGELRVPALAKLCDVSERGIYRYLTTWQNVGVHIKLNGDGYVVVDTHWPRIFEQKKLASAVRELITRGMKRCKNEKLLKQGAMALELLKPSRA